MKLKQIMCIDMLGLTSDGVKELESYVFSKNLEFLKEDDWGKIVLTTRTYIDFIFEECLYAVNINREDKKTIEYPWESSPRNYDDAYYSTTFGYLFRVKIHPIENNSVNYSKFMLFYVD